MPGGVGARALSWLLYIDRVTWLLIPTDPLLLLYVPTEDNQASPRLISYRGPASLRLSHNQNL